MPVLEFLIYPLTGACAALLLAGCGVTLLVRREPLSRRGRMLMGAALVLGAVYAASVAFVLWILVGFSDPG